ncbi:hypothetical protein BSKO_02525 [Bryopsis sp. KO-2023]|nr:hypothetical protein BSKO_02525 [Bryopsis sp. KO-2023]
MRKLSPLQKGCLDSVVLTLTSLHTQALAHGAYFTFGSQGHSAGNPLFLFASEPSTKRSGVWFVSKRSTTPLPHCAIVPNKPSPAATQLHESR